MIIWGRSIAPSPFSDSFFIKHHSASASAFRAAIASAVMQRCKALRTKFPHGERHIAKYTARIVLLYGCAFLFGNAVFGCLHQILRRTYDSDHREDAERNRQISSTPAILLSASKIQRCIQTCNHGSREIVFVTAAATVAFADTLHNICSKQDGAYHLYDCRRLIRLTTLGSGTCAKVIAANSMALKNADVALTTVKDHSLFKYCNSFQFLRTSTAYAGFKYKFDVKANIDRVKSTVELNRVDTDIGPNDLCASCPNCSRVLQDLVTKIRKVYAHVFKAIAISAGIQNAVRINAYGLTRIPTAWHTGKFIFCHCLISFVHEFRENSLC